MIKIYGYSILILSITLILLSSDCIDSDIYVKTLDDHTYVREGTPNDTIQFFKEEYVQTLYGVIEEGKPYTTRGKYEVKNGYVYLYNPELVEKFKLVGGRLTDSSGNVWLGI